MRKVLVSNIIDGMILGKKIYSANGHVLLAEGASLTSGYVQRLQALGIPAVLVKEDYLQDVVIPELVSERARIDSIVALRRIFEEARKYRKVDTALIKSLVNTLVDEMLQTRKFLFQIPDTRSYDSYLYGHCVNVCLLALRVGFSLNYNELQLRDLGVGALLHDIGTIYIEREVVSKAGKLSPTEFEQMKQHTIEGFSLLRDQKDINLLSAHVAYQHHERVEGSGYPRLLKGSEICEFARIVSIADMFDALTSERKHRKSFTYNKAVELLRKESGIQLDKDLIEVFLENIAVYPSGSLISLSSGEMALVIDNCRNNPAKPKVMLVSDRSKRVLPPSKWTAAELSDENKISVIDIVEDNKLIAKINKAFRDS